MRSVAIGLIGLLSACAPEQNHPDYLGSRQRLAEASKIAEQETLKAEYAAGLPEITALARTAIESLPIGEKVTSTLKQPPYTIKLKAEYFNDNDVSDFNLLVEARGKTGIYTLDLSTKVASWTVFPAPVLKITYEHKKGDCIDEEAYCVEQGYGRRELAAGTHSEYQRMESTDVCHGEVITPDFFDPICIVEKLLQEHERGLQELSLAAFELERRVKEKF